MADGAQTPISVAITYDFRYVSTSLGRSSSYELSKPPSQPCDAFATTAARQSAVGRR